MTEQTTLGQLIDALQKCGSDKNVIFDFGRLAPYAFSCYRGYYEQLALSYDEAYKVGHPKVSDVLVMAERAKGNSFEGYKGGSYVMNSSTPIWIAKNYGDCSDTMLIGVREREYEVVLETEYEP